MAQVTNANLINAERISVTFGTRTLLDQVSLGLRRGDVIGVVGRNGDGKTTLLRLLTGALEPDSGRVTRTGRVSVGYLHQADDFSAEASVRDVIVDGQADHVWAADAATRAVVEHLLADVPLDGAVGALSGGERRRVALVSLLLGDHDLLVLDEPTNHLDVEAVGWLAEQLRGLQERRVAMLVVSHDRWFLDAVCTRIWEVHDSVVDAYDGGYAAYVLARAERVRQAAGMAGRRRNLLRKELAWLRRGPPARTSKPRFRIDAANALIADEPPARDRLELQRFATARLGKDVFDLHRVHLTLGRRVLLDDLSWSIGPGDRIGLVGVNGSGKTSLLRLLTGDLTPDAGAVKAGRTLRLGHLSQSVSELSGRGDGPPPGGFPDARPPEARPPDARPPDARPPDARPQADGPSVDGTERVLESVERLRRQTRLLSGAEASASSLLEDFGFTGQQADQSHRRPVRRRASPTPVPPPAAHRAERAAAGRAHQRPRHRHADGDRGLPRLLARHLDRGQPRPLLPRAGLRRHVRPDGRRVVCAAARWGRAVSGAPARAAGPARVPRPSKRPRPPGPHPARPQPVRPARTSVGWSSTWPDWTAASWRCMPRWLRVPPTTSGSRACSANWTRSRSRRRPRRRPGWRQPSSPVEDLPANRAVTARRVCLSSPVCRRSERAVAEWRHGRGDELGAGMTALAQLVAELGDAVRTDPVSLENYRYDWSRDPTAGMPLAVVRPCDASEVQAVVRWASTHGVPVVPRGAGSGLSGGSSAVDGCVVVSLERMRAIEVDPACRVAVVEPGAFNAEVKAAAAEHGLWYPPDPSSYDICSIGGNVATNAGGLCCVKYGVTTDYVLGLDVVLADGTLVRLGGKRIKDVAGLSLLKLFVGSEGTLGIVTRAILRLIPAQGARSTLVASFPTCARPPRPWLRSAARCAPRCWS